MVWTQLAALIGVLSVGEVHSIGARELTTKDFLKGPEEDGLDFFVYRDTIEDDEDSFLIVMFYNKVVAPYECLPALQMWKQLGNMYNHEKGNVLVGQFDCEQPGGMDICKQWYKVDPPWDGELKDSDQQKHDSTGGWTKYPTIVWFDEEMWGSRASKNPETLYHFGEKYLMNITLLPRGTSTVRNRKVEGMGMLRKEIFQVPDIDVMKNFVFQYLEGIERNCNVETKQACNMEEVDGKAVEVLSADGCCLPDELRYLKSIEGMSYDKLRSERKRLKKQLSEDPLKHPDRMRVRMQRKLLAAVKHTKAPKKDL